MKNVIYFAYGSNMLTPRLRHRAPSSVLLSTASLPQHRLRFHKRSKDGSGKCNAYPTADASDAVYGALFEIPQEEKRKLDRTEGLGSGLSRAIRAGCPAERKADDRTDIFR
jgi:hypothetical protein